MMNRPHAVWLFPVTYAVHLAEEHVVGGGFPAWAQRTMGIQLSVGAFVAWNALGLTLMGGCAVLVSRDAKFRYLEIAIAIAVLGNVAAHVLSSVATRTYSPGLISGVLVWLPLGCVRLPIVSRISSHRTRVAGICLGAGVILATLGILAFGTVIER